MISLSAYLLAGLMNPIQSGLALILGVFCKAHVTRIAGAACYSLIWPFVMGGRGYNFAAAIGFFVGMLLVIYAVFGAGLLLKKQNRTQTPPN